MTMPASNISMITDVRNGFMQDGSGNVSLNSAKYRDGARKGSGNVALMDFASRAFSQGRTVVKTQDGSLTSSVKPYCWDQRHDNISHSSITWSLAYENGLPTWTTYHKGYRDTPTAAYSNSCFKANKNENLSISFTTVPNGNNWDASITFAILGFDAGYLSGNSINIINYTPASGSNTFNFTTNSSYPYHVVVFKTLVKAWNGALGYETRGGYTIKNVEVKRP